MKGTILFHTGSGTLAGGAIPDDAVCGNSIGAAGASACRPGWTLSSDNLTTLFRARNRLGPSGFVL